MEKKLISLILAAGMGKRMKSETPKVLHRVCGLSLCEWVRRASTDAGAEENILIIGHGAQKVQDAFGGSVSYAVQEEQKGTGHAVMCAKSFLEGRDGYVLILSGDAPLVNGQDLKDAFDYHIQFGNCATVITAIMDNPAGYGRIVRNDGGDVVKIVEQKDANEAELEICEINSGMYIFNIPDLLYALERLDSNNAQGEYYLTDTLEILIKSGRKVGATDVECPESIKGINDRIQLYEAEKIMQGRINRKHMENGVTMIDLNTTYIEADVTIWNDSIIYPGTIVKKGSVIGENVFIGPNCTITNSTIESGAEVINSVMTDAFVGEGAHIGPFAYLRPKSRIGKNVKIGDFVEIKNAVIDDGTKVSHLTYVGDADVGKNVNFGCGTVTVNYDGSKKHRTVIEDNAFIGCNTNLVSPVTVKKGAYIAAGSTITDEVPEYALAIARSRQVIKLDWNDKRNK